jgi:hypothetical protein
MKLKPKSQSDLRKERLALIMEDMVPCPPNHPYLVATGNVGGMCKMYRGHETVGEVECHALAALPVHNGEGELSSILFMVDRGNSQFEHLPLFGDGLAGCSIRIGLPTSALLVVEDVNSALSLNLATEFGTAAALYSENIPNVVASLRKMHPEKRIIVCAGAYGARELRTNEPFVVKAAQQSNAGIAIPDSGDHFNDLFIDKGAMHVCQRVFAGGVPVTKSCSLPSEVGFGVEAPRQWSGPVYGSGLMEHMMARIERHAILQYHQIVAICLWIILTHVVDVVLVLPILALISPVRRCGKTTVLGIAHVLVSRGLMSSNITPASLYRVVDDWKPTLIIDEADTFLAKSEELVGIVNAGHTRDSAFVYRVASGNKARPFNVFCPKLIAGIGHRSPTIMDRSIIITHQRKRHDEHVEKYRARENDDLVALRARIARWAADNQAAIAAAEFDKPDIANDRALDNWDPLLAIAACLGGNWLEAATEAAEALSVTNDKTMCSGEELLRDIKTVFSKRGDRIHTWQLIDDLCGDQERAWGTFHRGKPITPRQISKLLEDFEIKPDDVRIGEEVKKGYMLRDFVDAFARYVPE